MSGIAKIQQLRDDYRSGAGTTFTPGKEIWLKDGDHIFLTSIATGEEGDSSLDEYYMYTFRQNNRWTNVLRDDGIDQSAVPDDVRPSHKFAFWAYVYEIMHDEKRNEEWESVDGPGGKKLFKETINDFRIIPLGFGRSDYVWNQLVEVYEDWGSLDKGVLRIKRTGSGATDTSYSITATSRALEIPSEKGDEAAELDSVHSYLMERYGGSVDGEHAPTIANGTSKEDGLGDLF